MHRWHASAAYIGWPRQPHQPQIWSILPRSQDYWCLHATAFISSTTAAWCRLFLGAKAGAALNSLWAAALTTLINANFYRYIGSLSKQHCIKIIYRQDLQPLALSRIALIACCRSYILNIRRHYVTRWYTKYFNLNNWARYVDRINRQDWG